MLTSSGEAEEYSAMGAEHVSLTSHSGGPLHDKIQLLKEANQLNLFVSHLNEGIQWESERENIAKKTKYFFYNIFSPLKLPVGRLGVLYDMDYNSADTQLLINLSKYRYTNGSFVWLVLSSDFQKSTSVLDKLNLFVDADIVLGVYDEKHQSLDLFDVYNPGHGRGTELSATKLGYLSEASGLVIEERQSTIYRRRDLQGARVRAISVTKPYGDMSLEQYLTDRAAPYIDSFSKASYNLVLLLKDYYNFTMELVEGQSWWNPQSWDTSVVGMLNNDVGDFSVTCLRLVAHRVDYMDSYFELWEYSACFLFLKPATSGGLLSTELLRPFSGPGWVLIVVSTGVAALALCSAEMREKESISLVHSLLIAHGALCQQGSDAVPSRISGRIIFLFLFIMAFLLNNFYTSCVVSFLLDNKVSPINTIKEMVNSHLTIALENMSYNRVVIENPETDEIKYLKEELLKRGKQIKDISVPLREGVAEIRKGTTALYTLRASLYAVISETFLPENICLIKEIDVLPKNKLSTVIQKNSPFIEIFKTRSLWALETGLISRADRIYRPGRPMCHSGSVVGAVSNERLSALLFFLFLGALMASLLLLLECIVYKMKH